MVGTDENRCWYFLDEATMMRARSTEEENRTEMWRPRITGTRVPLWGQWWRKWNGLGYSPGIGAGVSVKKQRK
jgi:hypothetical protein